MAVSAGTLKHPIVLIHGLGARSHWGPFDYFFGLPARLRQNGNHLLVPNLTSWNTIERRAEQLREQIDRAYPKGKVNLIGHSLGGLDARYLASCLDFDDRIASITTVGTPHRGTIVSDLACGMLPGLALSAADRILKFMDASTGVVRQLSTEYCSEIFNRKARDSRRIGYFSATSAIRAPAMRHALPMFWLSHPIVHRFEGENDGFVSVKSAQWGEHICTETGDHYAQIGHLFGRSRGMDYFGFYDRIIKRLRREGF
jgi:triacylglycerol lipase